MSWKQLRDADMTVGYTGGWCLKYVQDAFHTDHISPTAAADWERQPAKHYDLPPLGITVPVYFSLGNVPAGHIAIRLDDGYVASSTLSGDHSAPYYHPSLDDLIAVYGKYNGGCTYLGWGEYVGSVHVVEWVPDVVTATADQVKQDYLDILERPVDADGLQHYTTNGMTNDQVRVDLLASGEYTALQAHKAAIAQAQADAAAKAQAQAEADAKAKAEQEAADAVAQAAAEERAKQTENQDPAQPAVDPATPQNKEDSPFVAFIQKIIQILVSIFK